MNDDLIKRIEADLAKSGFVSEMNAIRIFRGRSWGCSGGYGYFDIDEQKTRETDIDAHRVLVDEGTSPRIECFFHVVGEVKKCKNPWVVFGAGVENRLDAWNNLIFRDNLPLSGGNMVRELSENSLLSKCGWQGYGVHESFKTPSQGSKWYKAFVAACKASENVLKAESWDRDEKNFSSEKPVHISFVKPIVILDGLLFEAKLSDEDSIKLLKISSAPMVFSFQTRNYTRRDYSVDLVTLSGLGEYLELCELRHSDIVSGMRRMVECKLAAVESNTTEDV